MSAEGPFDAHHADRLWWAANPPKRRANTLTMRETAMALGIGVDAVRARLRVGTLVALPRKNKREQLFFSESYIADVALAAQIKKAAHGR